MVRSEMDERKRKEVRVMKKEERTWKIWYWKYDENKNVIERGFRVKEYKRRGYAERVANKLFALDDPYCWLVSDTNPFIKKCDICGKDIHVNAPFDPTSTLRYRVYPAGEKQRFRWSYLNTLCTDCAENLADMVLKYVCEHGQKEAPNDKT